MNARSVRERCLQQAVMQMQHPSLDMNATRTGPVPERVARLLRLLGHKHHIAQSGPSAQAGASRATLPRLRELAAVFDAQHETVCRAPTRSLTSRGGRSGPLGNVLAAPRQRLSAAVRMTLQLAVPGAMPFPA